MEKEKLALSISSEKKRFKEHLILPDNDQIIFSGIFGIGKTYFLNEFFEDEKEQYETIKISPVNYSISSNDDIIDYIKYDIIFQLLSKGIDFEKTDFSKELTSQMYVKESFTEVMTLLAKNATKINKSFAAVFGFLTDIKEKIDIHNTEVNIDEKEELIEFLTSMKDKTGSIYEENNLTVLIASLISGLKADGKKVVLIIDDTDRLDPEHVFRIFNVFACHFEFGKTEENKFSIDKVVLVCDIDNIRKMFYSKYGQDVDFSGYIDKFYSKEIYYLDTKKVITDSIDNLLSSVNNSNDLKLLSELKYSESILKAILFDMVKTNSINLRSLLKIHNLIFDFKEYNFKKGIDSSRSNLQYDIVLIFDFLSFLLGSKINIESSLNKLQNNASIFYLDSYNQLDYGAILVFLELDKYERSKKEYIYENENLDIKISYNTECAFRSNKYTGDLVKFEYMKGEPKNIFPLYELLNLAFDKYKKLQIISLE
ncbi:P-loop NTPase fold protein [Tenacibaculum finnmarkense]|uniref:P-loop NTPase fold protein n=1 Tax=Tenacibaculum finnmarkense TaxID=2781243 RepID=UPI003BB5A1FC